MRQRAVLPCDCNVCHWAQLQFLGDLLCLLLVAADLISTIVWIEFAIRAKEMSSAMPDTHFTVPNPLSWRNACDSSETWAKQNSNVHAFFCWSMLLKDGGGVRTMCIQSFFSFSQQTSTSLVITASHQGISHCFELSFPFLYSALSVQLLTFAKRAGQCSVTCPLHPAFFLCREDRSQPRT